MGMNPEVAQLAVSLPGILIVALLLGRFSDTISEATDAMRKEETGVDVNAPH